MNDHKTAERQDRTENSHRQQPLRLKKLADIKTTTTYTTAIAALSRDEKVSMLKIARRQPRTPRWDTGASATASSPVFVPFGASLTVSTAADPGVVDLKVLLFGWHQRSGTSNPKPHQNSMTCQCGFKIRNSLGALLKVMQFQSTLVA